MYILGAGGEPMARAQAGAQDADAAKWGNLQGILVQAGAAKKQAALQRQMMLDKLGFDAQQGDADRGLKQYGIDTESGDRRAQMAGQLGFEREKLGQDQGQFTARLGADTADRTAMRGIEQQKADSNSNWYKAQADDLAARTGFAKEDRAQDPNRVLNKLKIDAMQKALGLGAQDGGAAPLPGEEAPQPQTVPGGPQFASYQGGNQPIQTADATGAPAPAVSDDPISRLARITNAFNGVTPEQAQFKIQKERADLEYQQKMQALGLSKATREDQGALSPGALAEKQSSIKQSMVNSFINKKTELMKAGIPGERASAEALNAANVEHKGYIDQYKVPPLTLADVGTAGTPVAPVAPLAIAGKLQSLTGIPRTEDAMADLTQRYAQSQPAGDLNDGGMGNVLTSKGFRASDFVEPKGFGATPYGSKLRSTPEYRQYMKDKLGLSDLEQEAAIRQAR